MLCYENLLSDAFLKRLSIDDEINLGKGQNVPPLAPAT